MSDVDRLLAEYIAEHRSGGEANPLSYLEQVEGTDREELRVLLDAYLQRAPARGWDPQQFSGSEAERLTEGLQRSLTGAAGLWPVALPRLRERAQVKRAELVKRLADALGHSQKQEKVGGYYHEMERGGLEASGVSPNVLEALGSIVGASAESLRNLGQAVEGAAAEGGAQPAFARRARGAELDAGAEDMAEAPASRPAAAGEEWDEVDELFRGGVES